MKALSIKQPWAWLICAGYKDIENRSWAIPISFRLPQRIYVHAGKMVDWEATVKIGKGYLRRISVPAEKAINGAQLTLGSIIGEVDIIDSSFRFGEENDNLYSIWHVPGQNGFKLANPVLYDKPIPYKGQLGFFDVNLENLK